MAGGRGRRARWAAPVLAGVATLGAGVLAIATNIATGLVPNSWAATHNPVVMWGLVAGLLLVTALLVTWASRSSRSDGGGEGEGEAAVSASSARVRGSVTGSVVAPAASSGRGRR